jgi:transposase
MIYTEKMTQQVFIRFLSQLTKLNQKVFLIVDNLKVHHGKRVKAWLAGKELEIELFYLPSYSPELNPDEYLNRDLKKNVHSKSTRRTIEALKANILSFMRKIQKLPDRVKKYFNSRSIKHATA